MSPLSSWREAGLQAGMVLEKELRTKSSQQNSGLGRWESWGALERSGGGHWEVGEQEGGTGSSFLFPCVLACKEEFLFEILKGFVILYVGNSFCCLFIRQNRLYEPD